MALFKLLKFLICSIYMRLCKCNWIYIIPWYLQQPRGQIQGGKVSDKFWFLMFDLTILPCEEEIIYSQNWISFSTQRLQSWWTWYEYLMINPSVGILPCGRNTTLGQNSPWIQLPCDNSMLAFQACNRGGIISHIKSQTRTKALCNIKNMNHQQ